MRTQPKRVALRTLAALAMGALLATSACNGNSGSTSGGGAAGALLIAADDGSPTYVRNFNPFSPTARLGATYMYEPLEVVNTLDGKATPFLATRATFKDPKTLVYTIRRGVKWSDGQPFTPADVAYTFALVKKNPELDLHGDWQHLASVEVAGDTVICHLKAPDAPAAFVLDQQLIVPEHIWQKVSDPLKFTDTDPVVTGPYVLDSFSPNAYSLKKNPTYWQASKVAADKLTFTADNSQLNIVHNGYDWAYAFLPDVKGTWVKADPTHNSYWFPAGGTIGLIPNLTKPPYNNLDFREGLSYALDRKKIGDDAEQGYVQPAAQTGLLPSEKAWLDPSLPDGGAITQDTSKALDYFSKAGYTKSGDKLVDAHGKQLAISIVTANGYTDWLQGLQTVQSELESLGMTVTIKQPQPAAYQDALNNGDFDLAMAGYGGTGSVFQDFNTMLNSDFATPVGKATSANFGRFSNPAVDELLDQLKVAVSDSAQKSVAYKLERAVYTRLPVISMFYGGLWGLFSDQNFTGWPSASDPYAPPNTWNSTPLLILTHIRKA